MYIKLPMHVGFKAIILSLAFHHYLLSVVLDEISYYNEIHTDIMVDPIEIESIVKNSYSSRAISIENSASCCESGNCNSSEDIENSSACCENDNCNASANSSTAAFCKNDLKASPSLPVSFGCNNQVIDIADFQVGEVVVDLGSGPGHDAILAANKVGEDGKVIGIDFTNEMIKIASDATVEYENVEFVEGNIKEIPLDDQVADVVISNCVINLVVNKKAVFSEAYRILKPKGRIIVADMIAQNTISSGDRLYDEKYCACIGGATSIENYIEIMEASGFSNIQYTKSETKKLLIGGDEEPYLSVVFSGFKS